MPAPARPAPAPAAGRTAPARSSASWQVLAVRHAVALAIFQFELASQQRAGIVRHALECLPQFGRKARLRVVLVQRTQLVLRTPGAGLVAERTIELLLQRLARARHACLLLGALLRRQGAIGALLLAAFARVLSGGLLPGLRLRRLLAPALLALAALPAVLLLATAVALAVFFR